MSSARLSALGQLRHSMMVKSHDATNTDSHSKARDKAILDIVDEEDLQEIFDGDDSDVEVNEDEIVDLDAEGIIGEEIPEDERIIPTPPSLQELNLMDELFDFSAAYVDGEEDGAGEMLVGEENAVQSMDWSVDALLASCGH